MSSAPVRSGRLRRGERVALAVALAWSTAFLIAAAALPSYEVVTESPSGGLVHDSATAVEVNGSSILLIAGIPLLATIIVGSALWRRGGRVGAGPVAWGATVMQGGLTLLGMLTIGPLVMPVTVSLVVACAIHRGRTS